MSDPLDEAEEALDAALEGPDDDEEAHLAAAEQCFAALELTRAAGGRKDEASEERFLAAWDLVVDAWLAWPPAFDPGELAGVARDDFDEDDALLHEVEGLAALFSGDSQGAADSLVRAVALEPDQARAQHLLGVALERTGDDARADAALARAAELAPEVYLRPLRLDGDRFFACVERAIEELPAEIRAALREQFTVAVEDFPPDELVREGTDPFVLGLCVGRDLGNRVQAVDDDFTAAREAIRGDSSQIIVYARNLERICATEEELVEEIRVTLFHEVGHALGFDEDGVDDLGLA